MIEKKKKVNIYGISLYISNIDPTKRIRLALGGKLFMMGLVSDEIQSLSAFCKALVYTTPILDLILFFSLDFCFPI